MEYDLVEQEEFKGGTDVDFKIVLNRHLNRIGIVSANIAQEGMADNFLMSVTFLEQLLSDFIDRDDGVYLRELEEVNNKIEEKMKSLKNMNKIDADPEKRKLKIEEATMKIGLLIKLMGRNDLMPEPETILKVGRKPK